MEEQLLETWAIHDQINRYLLAAVPPEALPAVSASKGRTVAHQFAHIHNVRVMWLKSAAPELSTDMAKIEKDDPVDAAILNAALEQSGTAIATLLRQSFAAGGRVKGFKPHAVGVLGYLISHESHHRGQIARTLTQAGFPLDQPVAFGIWEWGVRGPAKV
jgi:uncharacterized damage-inducible protein DinB